ADDHRRKAAKRTLPAEFAEYAQGVRHFPRPLYFIGGNNEDFASLDGMPDGGTLAPNVHYLGRAGTVDREGLAIAYLSGIYAPRFIDAPLEPPTSAVKAKQAGYFRTSDLERLRGASRADLMLLHEWPRGLVRRVQGGLKLRAHRFPWIGNPVVREGVARIRPSWLFCGHSHVHWPPRSNFRKVASPAWPAWTRLPVRKEPCFG
ncbi:MAG TPA: hypothetical protein VEY30_06715, partial [Myxococcaceae bacterium]|nr:hypothetical protein [Myxococcaceae bacterium]